MLYNESVVDFEGNIIEEIRGIVKILGIGFMQSASVRRNTLIVLYLKSNYVRRIAL